MHDFTLFERIIGLHSRISFFNEKSLRAFDDKHHTEQLLRTTLLNLRKDGKILHIPLYALTAIGRLSTAE